MTRLPSAQSFSSWISPGLHLRPLPPHAAPRGNQAGLPGFACSLRLSEPWSMSFVFAFSTYLYIIICLNRIFFFHSTNIPEGLLSAGLWLEPETQNGE